MWQWQGIEDPSGVRKLRKSNPWSHVWAKRTELLLLSDQRSTVTFRRAFAHPSPRCLWTHGHSGQPRFPSHRHRQGTNPQHLTFGLVQPRRFCLVDFPVLKSSKMITKDSHIGFDLGCVGHPASTSLRLPAAAWCQNCALSMFSLRPRRAAHCCHLSVMRIVNCKVSIICVQDLGDPAKLLL